MSTTTKENPNKSEDQTNEQLIQNINTFDILNKNSAQIYKNYSNQLRF